MYNVAGEGVLSVRDMVRMLGNTCVPLPYGLTHALNGVAWALRLSVPERISEPVSPDDPVLVGMSTDKLKRELGYPFRYDTVRAFEDFVKFVKAR